MHTQRQLLKTLRSHCSEVTALVAGGGDRNRHRLAIKLCEHFAFHDPRGQLQVGSCLKALRTLEAAGAFTLPARRHPQAHHRHVRRLPGPVAPPQAVPDRVDRVQGLTLVLVETEEHYRTWNELMIREHPQGRRPLVGRQVRYLLGSAHGWLGALGFSASALALHDRDQWIGWDRQGRAAHLDKVVCLSRLLIRPGVNCENLASKVLSLACRALGRHFAQRYGYRPWVLETFVETKEAGTCYRAANWLRVGRTRGRGRQDRQRRRSLGAKDIYLYVLEPRFRTWLGVPAPEDRRPLGLDEGLDKAGWTAREFGGTSLGDQRLQQRLITIAANKDERPGSAIVEAIRGDRAAMKGYYRFIDAPDARGISFDSILQPHAERTCRRLQTPAALLIVHDSTDLNYATLETCTGLGVIGKNQTGTVSQGLRLHTSYALTAEEGLPLGILQAECTARQLQPERKGKDRRAIPDKDKESYRWIRAWQACEAKLAPLPGRRITHVMDREADFFGLFDAWRQQPCAHHLVVRALCNHRTGGEQKLFDLVAASPLKREETVEIPRKSSRPKHGKKPPTPAREKRRATLHLRYLPATLLPPEYGVNHHQPAVPITIVHIREAEAPADGSERIEWYLLTTCPVATPEEASQVFHAYVKRWRIEEWHRILKVCCGAEEPANRTAGRLQRVLAINLVIAWRIHLMTLLGREFPELPPDVLFADTEITVLRRMAATKRTPAPENLGDCIRLTAALGGYLNRRNDGPPGAEVLWRGLLRLADMSYGYTLFDVSTTTQDD
jgi:hypothetical protein